jgi:hypothetical protein
LRSPRAKVSGVAVTAVKAEEGGERKGMRPPGKKKVPDTFEKMVPDTLREVNA